MVNLQLPESWGSKQVYRVTNQRVSVVSQCSLNAWLKDMASGDQRRLTESGSALEACSRRCAIQFHSLFYFTLLHSNLEKKYFDLIRHDVRSVAFEVLNFRTRTVAKNEYWVLCTEYWVLSTTTTRLVYQLQLCMVHCIIMRCRLPHLLARIFLQLSVWRNLAKNVRYNVV